MKETSTASKPVSPRAPISTLNQRLYKVQREVAAQRARNQQLQSELKAAENELRVLRKALASTSFRLGKLITRALRSPAALVSLPRELWRLRAESKARRASKR